MINGLGNDIIEAQRILEAIDSYGDRFLSRLFTEEEIRYCSKYRDAHVRYAGRFAAKEAISKALGVGFGKSLKWKDLTIKNDERGKPQVELSSSANRNFNNPKLLISISHCKKFASAVAIWVT